MSLMKSKDSLNHNSSQEVHEKNVKNSLGASGITEVERAFIAGFRRSEKLSITSSEALTSEQIKRLARDYQLQQRYEENYRPQRSQPEDPFEFVRGRKNKYTA